MTGPVTQSPPRAIINAVEGWGKTSMGSNSDKPLIVMARGETGYTTLLGAGLVPEVPRASVETWGQTLAVVDKLIASDTGIKTIVFDALGGFERLCHEFVCDRDFEGDWGEHGFASYQKGYDRSVTDWLILLARLDRLRETRGTAVLFLSHCKVRTFKNPIGPDYDRWVSDVHEKTWAVTAKWADTVLFGTFRASIETQKGGDINRKGKGIGFDDRMLYTTRRDAYDAKNRYGMPEKFDCNKGPSDAWAQVWAYIGQTRKDVTNAANG